MHPISFIRPRAGLLLTALLFMARAGAASVPAPAPGDLFVGFRASDGQGSSTSYLVNLGPDTVFRGAAPGSSFEITGVGNIGADLAATFGANWHARSDVLWGIFGVRTSVNSTVYGSRARTSLAGIAPAWPALNSTGRNGVAGSITSVIEEVGGYKAGQATANSGLATFQVNTGEASSYNRQVGTPGTTDFGSLSQWTSIEANFGNEASGAVLDLFRIAAAGSSHVGSFSISNTGTIRFSAAPLTADGDADGDGFSDAEEAVAGTNPGDPAAFPRAEVSFTANGPRVQSPTVANRTYAIEYSETLGGSTWLQVNLHTSGPGAIPIDFVDTDPERRARGQGFYRIRISS